MDASEAIGALRDASKATREALRLVPAGRHAERVELLLRIARSEQLTGELSAARKSLRRLANHSVARDNPVRTAEVYRQPAVVNSLQAEEDKCSAQLYSVTLAMSNVAIELISE